MSRRPFLLKIVFSVLSVFLGLWLILMWYPGAEADYAAGREAGRGAGPLKAGLATDRGAAGVIEPSRTSYEIIAKKNIFNSERKEKWAVKKAPPRRSTRMAVPRAMNARNTLILEGVVLFEGSYTALVKDTTKPREGVRPVRVGDTIGAFTVVSIKDEALTLKGNDGTIKVLKLYNKEKPVKRRGVTTPVIPLKRLAPAQKRSPIRR